MAYKNYFTLRYVNWWTIIRVIGYCAISAVAATHYCQSPHGCGWNTSRSIRIRYVKQWTAVAISRLLSSRFISDRRHAVGLDAALLYVT